METLANSQYPIITLCGSTKFSDAYIEWNKKLSLAGFCVLSVGLFGHKIPGFDMSGEEKHTLDAVHLQKIKMSDAIFVLNVNDYIGASTWNEIDFALANYKTIFFLNSLTLCNFKLALDKVCQYFPRFKYEHEYKPDITVLGFPKIRNLSLEASQRHILKMKEVIDNLKIES